MNFVSQPFLGFFFLVFTAYWLIPRHRLRMGWLLLASCAFYMSWSAPLILLILFTASVDYVAALLLERTEPLARRRLILTLSIATNLGLLAFFKYANFFMSNVQSAFNLVGLDFDRPVFQVALPLGISFYTFETISYIVDVYRKKIAPVRNLLDYSLYIMFFPHLIAGPIVRPGDFLPQIQRRKRFDWARLEAGIRIFLLGFFKKAVLADYLGTIADPVFESPGDYGSTAVWLGVVAYAFQIYGDFSGYSDMAIGLAYMFGFKLQANFNMPYLAGNIAEFWHRWHISLSSWLRDYLYIPLGGSRGGSWATYRNLLLTMLLGGLWHGANWTFVFWGLFHGTLLAVHRAFFSGKTSTSWIYRGVSVLCTFVCVCIGWVFFRAQTLGDAWSILGRMAWPLAGEALPAAGMALVLTCLAAMLIGHLAGATLEWPRLVRRLPRTALGAALALFFLAALILLPEDGRLFIYFQF
jgi:alginate O-acetyltransferase complex protein AlgI